MKELQEVDSDGAPLLFHAASSRREHSCFRTARDLVYTVLGEGGLMGQTEAVDALGRGLLMHAARSKHLGAFREAFDMREEATDSITFFKETSATLNTASEAPADTPAGVVLSEVMGQFDRLGMSCLHHAAEAGCYEVLRDVMEKCGGAGSSLYQEMNKADGFQRTPIMLVLRNACGGEENAGDSSALKDKFDLLYEAMPCEPALTPGGHRKIGWMGPALVPSHRVLVSTDPFQPRAPTRAVTELMHAVRGGVSALQLVLSNPLPASKTEVDGGFAVDLDEALAVEALDDDGRWVRTDGTRTWGRALLLATAALRGDIDVLYRVLDAIEVSQQLPFCRGKTMFLSSRQL